MDIRSLAKRAGTLGLPVALTAAQLTAFSPQPSHSACWVDARRCGADPERAVDYFNDNAQAIAALASNSTGPDAAVRALAITSFWGVDMRR